MKTFPSLGQVLYIQLRKVYPGNREYLTAWSDLPPGTQALLEEGASKVAREAKRQEYGGIFDDLLGAPETPEG